MVFILFLIFIVVPIVEISILIQVGEQLGVMSTIGLVILTAAIGASLVRSQGLQTLMTAQQKIQQGQQASQEVIEGIMLAIAGVLLVTPGFATDTLGLLMLMPLTRKPIANYFVAKLVAKGMGGAHARQPFSRSAQNDDDIIDGEFSRKEHEQHIEHDDKRS